MTTATMSMKEIQDIFDKNKRVLIPERPKKVLEYLATIIKPVVLFKERSSTIKQFLKEKIKEGLKEAELLEAHERNSLGLYYIKPVDIFNVAYTWDAKRDKKATGLTKVLDITTYHRYGYYGLFKPSIAEILAQIPISELFHTFAFEIIKHPETAADLSNDITMHDGYHIARTRLYGAIESTSLACNGDTMYHLKSYKEAS